MQLKKALILTQTYEDHDLITQEQETDWDKNEQATMVGKVEALSRAGGPGPFLNLKVGLNT